MACTLIIPAFAGWLAGLVVNYLADVLPMTRTLSRPACRKCDREYTLLEYSLMRRCRNGHHRGLRAWITQVLLVSAGLHIWLTPPEKLSYVLGLILATYFALVFVIDLEHRLILHPTSIFGAVLALVVGVLAHGLNASLIGGFSGLVIMLVFYFLGTLFARFRSRRMVAAGREPDDEEALGSGDVILVTILGLILGWPLIWFGLLFGILLGGAVSLFIVLWLVVSRRYGTNALMYFIPYGPYFIASAWLIIFFPRWLAMIVPD